MADKPSDTDYLQRMARDIQDIKSEIREIINAIKDAETEVPEKIRRFVMYFHDVRDMVSMYREIGSDAPAHVLREIERCDDRYRHLLEDLNSAGGTFEKVRRDMTQKDGNRWDHSLMLPKQGQTDETGNGKQ
jgi:hypothetical protein